MKANIDLREYAEMKGIRLYQVGRQLGKNDGNMSRYLRYELTTEQKEQIRSIIDELAKQVRHGDA